MKKFILIFLILTTSVVFAAEKVTIEADSVDTPQKSIYHATGNVKVFQGDKTLLANEVYFDKAKNSIHAIGDVKLTENGSIMNCSDMVYDTEKETGIFTDAKAFMPPYNWITASKIDKKSKLVYKLDDATFTTCDGSRPDWSFKASEANITVGGYLSSWNTTARIKNVPFLYTPYFIYPIKNKRESGFLVPNMGYSSKLGAFIQPKFYWDIDVDQDATFSVLAPSNKPTLEAVEHRYLPNKNSSIYTYVEYTAADKKYPGDQDGEFKLYKDPGRYFLYNKTSLAVTDKLYFNAYIDTVSDYDYLSDYKKYSMLQNYENDTDVYNANLTLSYYSKYSDIALSYFDATEYNLGRYYRKEHTYSQPRLTMSKTFTALPVYVNYLFQYDNVRYTRYSYDYNRSQLSFNDIKYNREHYAVKFYKPVDMYIGTFRPSITLYKTRWHNIENTTARPADERLGDFAKINTSGDSIERTIYTQVHSFTLNEIYKNYKYFRHSIYNTFTYRQTPKLNQSGLLNYINYDRIDAQREYLYTLSNYFTANTWQLNVKNSVVYDMMRNTKRYDDFITEVNLTTVPVSFHMKDEYNKYDKDVNYFSTGAALRLQPFTFNASYTFDKDNYITDNNNTTVSLGVTYTSGKYDLSYTRASAGKNDTLKWGKMPENTDTLSVTYKKDCWTFGVSYIRDTNPVTVDVTQKSKVEHTIMFTISLRGIGEYSSSVLQRTTGYEGNNNAQ